MAVAAIVLIGGFFIANNALAAATVTPASGGTNISIDTTSASGGSGTFKTLSGPTITETVPGDISVGTHTITLPTGWEFDTGSTVTVYVTAGDIEPSTQIITPSTDSFTFTITSPSTINSSLAFIISSMKVRPTGTVSGTTGEMTHSGATIAGVTDGSTSFGTLSTVAGTVTQLAFTTQPGATTVYGSNLSTQPVVKTQDQFGNNSTSGLGGSETVILSVTSGTGTLGGTLESNIVSGTATFADLTATAVGIDNVLTAATTGLTPLDSDHFDITPAPLTITTENKTKVYGTANPTLTATYTGFVNSETEAVLTSPVVLSTSADTTTPVGTPAITVVGATAINYNISFVPGTLTITPAPLTITADAQTKVYGENDPALTYTTSSFVNSETISVLSGLLSRDAGETVGAKAITSTLANSNYAITYNSANLTITARPITVTAVTNTKTYNGFPTAEGTPTITSGSLATGDTATYSETYDTATAGTGKTLTPSVVIKNSSNINVTANYNVSLVSDSTGAINQAPLTITAENKTKVYGTANPTLTATYSGFVNGETSAILDTPVTLSTSADNTTDVGTPAITASNATDVNYNITFVPGVLTITQAPLTVSFATDANKTYDGDNSADITGRTLSGVVSSDNVTVSGGSATFANKNIGTGLTVTATGFILGGTDEDNYSIGTINTTTGNVNARAITVTAKTDTKTYDSLATSDETPIVTSTFSPAIATVDTAIFTQAYDNKNVGTGKTLTPSGTITDGNNGNNYAVTLVNDSTGEITKKPLTATVTVANKVYNGNNSATITGVTLNSVESGDVGTVNTIFVGATATFNDPNGKDVGNNKPVTATGVVLGGAGAGNYSYAGPATGTGNIFAIPTIVYVNKSWNGTTLWTDPDGAGIGATFFGYDAFATIQEGINAVGANGTVNVAAGIYAEQVLIQKSLTLIGAGVGQTIVKDVLNSPTTRNLAPGLTAPYAWNSDYLLAAYPADWNGTLNTGVLISVKISGFTFDANNQTHQGDRFTGVFFGSVNNTTIANAGLFNSSVIGFNISDPSATGVRVLGNSNLTVDNNSVGYTINGISTYGDNGIAPDPYVVVSNNTVTYLQPASTGYDEQGIMLAYGASGMIDHNTLTNGTNGIILSYANNSTVSNNILSNISAGVGGTDGMAMGWSIVLDNTSSNNTISNNTVTNSELGLWDSNGANNNTFTGNILSGNFIGAQVDTYSGGAEPTGLHFNNNSFTGSSVKEFINNTAVTTDISNNYWGTAVATTVASKISGLVSFDPYYVDSAKTILSSTVPFAVYVDDNYSDGFSGSYYFGYNAFATIQEGVDAVAANGTVNVAAGGYTENLIVNKSLTIKGVGDTAIIDGNINATGDNVTIQSLKIINSNSHDGGVSDYGVKATAGKALTLETVTVDVLHDAISMTGDSTLNNTALTINNSTIKGYGALVISGAIKSAGNKNAVVTIHDTSLTGTTSYSGSSDDFSVIGTNNTKNVNINFTGTNSVTNEYTNDAQAKERLISFYNSNNITVTGLPIYTNAGNSKVSTDALFVSAYGPYTNTVQGRNVARYVSNTTEFESALASSATTPIVVGRYETDINTTAGTKTLKTGVTLIIEDHTPVTISNGTTLINNGTIIIESGASLINNGTLQSISITGDAKYGQLLTAAVTGITNAGTPAYQWKRDGADISGATTATYTVVTDDIGKVITATATTVSGITGTGSITSAGTGAVTKADQTTLVAVATPSTVVYGSTSALTAIGGSGTGAVTYSVGDSSGCSVTDSTLSVTNANGSCAVTATKATDANYNSATSGALAVTLQKAGQTITFGSLSGKTYGDTNFDVAATTDSSLSTTFSVGGSDNCTISGATVSITGAGSCTVTAHQVGSDNYSSAPDVAQTFSIATKAITITAVADNKGFGLTDPLFTYTVTGTLVGNDVFTGSLARVAGETLGTYAINQGTLALNTNYTITYVSALFTIKDITAPTILSSYAPSSNAVGVDPTGNISIPFSEAVNIVSGDITLTTGGSPVEFAIEGNGTANIVVNPGATLSNNSTYIVTVKITTADLAGNHLASEKSWTFTTAGSYSFTLSNGWNLVALGVVPNNNSVSTILGSSSTNVESIWSYDAVANTWSVNHPNDGADTDTLSSMTAGNGYWVNYIGASSVTLSGSGNLFLAGENTPPSRTLKAGWNLIGYYQRESNTTAVVTNALKTLKSQDATPIPWWSMIVKHDNSAKQFGTVENSNFLSSGQGYWILMGGRATDTYIYAPGITDL